MYIELRDAVFKGGNERLYRDNRVIELGDIEIPGLYAIIFIGVLVGTSIEYRDIRFIELSGIEIREVDCMKLFIYFFKFFIFSLFR